MNKKLFYVVPLAGVLLFSHLGSDLVDVKASALQFKIPNTTIQLEHYKVKGENKELRKREVIERNDDLSEKSRTTYDKDDVTKELELAYKAEYSYDSKGNIIKEEDYSKNDGTLKYCGKYTYEYNSDNYVVLAKRYNDTKQEAEYEYTYNGKLLNSLKEYYFNDESEKIIKQDCSYQYNVNNLLSKEVVLDYNNGTFSFATVRTYDYYEDGKLKSKQEDFSKTITLDSLDLSGLNTYEYSGDTVTDVRKQYNKAQGKYEPTTKIITKETDTLYDTIRYFVESDAWSFYDGTKIEYKVVNGKIANCTFTEYDTETDLNTYLEIVYTHMEISSKGGKNNKSSSHVGAIIGGVLGGFFFILLGLFYFWKKELKKAIEDGDKNDRRLKIFDIIYRPINRIIFGKDKDPFEVEEKEQ